MNDAVLCRSSRTSSSSSYSSKLAEQAENKTRCCRVKTKEIYNKKKEEKETITNGEKYQLASSDSQPSAVADADDAAAADAAELDQAAVGQSVSLLGSLKFFYVVTQRVHALDTLPVGGVWGGGVVPELI